MTRRCSDSVASRLSGNIDMVMRSKTLQLINRKHDGFTLLEIMVVIVILGLLASFIVPNLMGNKDKADRQKASSDLVALENALDMYRLDNGRYPSAEQGLNALIEKPSIPPVPAHYPEEGYLRFLPQDPCCQNCAALRRRCFGMMVLRHS